MDTSKLTPMMQQYMKIKEKYPGAILFYRLGDFYEMFFDDALEASKVLEIALTGRNAGLDEKVPMCGVPFHAAKAYIKKLIDSGYRIAICEQLEDPSAGNKIVRRDVVKVITPGTNLDTVDENYNYLMYIDESHPSFYHLALCDLATGKLKALKINKDKQKLYNEILSYQIKEIVVDKNFDTSLFNELLKKYKVLVSFSAEEIKDINIINNIETEFKRAFAKLLTYIESMQMEEIDYFMEVDYLDDDYMKLDFSSKFNLELVNTIRNNEKYGTLFWYLDKTKTAMGSRLLREFIEAPLLVEGKIKERQAFVSAFLTNFIQAEEVGKLLRSVYDIARIAAKVGLRKVTPKELLWLKQSLEQAKLIIDELRIIDEKEVQEFIAEVDLLEDLYDKIEQTIYLAILDGDNEKIINDSVDDLLDQYRTTLQDSTKWLVDFEQKQRDLTGIKNLKVKYNKVFGYYIEVSNSNKSMIKDEYGYTRKQTLANAERYINAELKEQESLILNAQDNLSKLEQELYNNFKDEIHHETTKLQTLSKQLAYLDVMYAFYRVSNNYGYSKPEFNQHNIIEIEECFHPIIKAVDQDRDFINNDFIMEEKTNVLLITGPNMGGKSTYMRQLALVVIMAQIGCYVPAQKANLMLFDQIFTRIGASDDLIQGQSTFMVEMLEAGNAILNATDNSLILFDEIGRGTATYDGMAIAYAMLEYLSQKTRAKLLFSTHYHELVELEKVNTSIKNYHAAVLENANDITFTYKVKPGNIDKSYGIHVAKLAHLPTGIIERAYQLLSGFETSDIKVNNEVKYIEVENEANKAIMDSLKSIDLNNISPLQALQYLDDLKKKVN